MIVIKIVSEIGVLTVVVFGMETVAKIQNAKI